MSTVEEERENSQSKPIEEWRNSGEVEQRKKEKVGSSNSLSPSPTTAPDKEQDEFEGNHYNLDEYSPFVLESPVSDLESLEPGSERNLRASAASLLSSDTAESPVGVVIPAIRQARCRISLSDSSAGSEEHASSSVQFIRSMQRRPISDSSAGDSKPWRRPWNPEEIRGSSSLGSSTKGSNERDYNLDSKIKFAATSQINLAASLPNTIGNDNRYSSKIPRMPFDDIFKRYNDYMPPLPVPFSHFEMDTYFPRKTSTYKPHVYINDQWLEPRGLEIMHLYPPDTNVPDTRENIPGSADEYIQEYGVIRLVGEPGWLERLYNRLADFDYDYLDDLCSRMDRARKERFKKRVQAHRSYAPSPKKIVKRLGSDISVEIAHYKQLESGPEEGFLANMEGPQPKRDPDISQREGDKQVQKPSAEETPPPQVKETQAIELLVEVLSIEELADGETPPRPRPPPRVEKTQVAGASVVGSLIEGSPTGQRPVQTGSPVEDAQEGDMQHDETTLSEKPQAERAPTGEREPMKAPREHEENKQSEEVPAKWNTDKMAEDGEEEEGKRSVKDGVEEIDDVQAEVVGAIQGATIGLSVKEMAKNPLIKEGPIEENEAQEKDDVRIKKIMTERNTQRGTQFKERNQRDVHVEEDVQENEKQEFKEQIEVEIEKVKDETTQNSGNPQYKEDNQSPMTGLDFPTTVEENCDYSICTNSWSLQLRWVTEKDVTVPRDVTYLDDCEYCSTKGTSSNPEIPDGLSGLGVVYPDPRDPTVGDYQLAEPCRRKERCDCFDVNLAHPKLILFNTTDGRGVGLRAFRNIEKGGYIGEFRGKIVIRNHERQPEIIQQYMEMDMRFAAGGHWNDKMDFGLDENGNKQSYSYYIDAKNAGNETRFINHHCDPDKVNAEHSHENHKGRMALAIRATKNILKGGEILLDYGTMDDWTIFGDQCLCQSKRCRYLAMSITHERESYTVTIHDIARKMDDYTVDIVPDYRPSTTIPQPMTGLLERLYWYRFEKTESKIENEKGWPSGVKVKVFHKKSPQTPLLSSIKKAAVTQRSRIS